MCSYSCPCGCVCPCPCVCVFFFFIEVWFYSYIIIFANQLTFRLFLPPLVNFFNSPSSTILKLNTIRHYSSSSIFAAHKKNIVNKTKEVHPRPKREAKALMHYNLIYFTLIVNHPIILSFFLSSHVFWFMVACISNFFFFRFC